MRLDSFPPSSQVWMRTITTTGTEIGSSKKERLKQKRYQVRALKQTDLMPLYSMRDIDIIKVTELVLQKKVSVKSTKSTKKQPVLPGLNEACHLEKRRRLIKNEFMHYFKKKELRCKTMRAARTPMQSMIPLR